MRAPRLERASCTLFSPPPLAQFSSAPSFAHFLSPSAEPKESVQPKAPLARAYAHQLAEVGVHSSKTREEAKEASKKLEPCLCKWACVIGERISNEPPAAGHRSKLEPAPSLLIAMCPPLPLRVLVASQM